MEDKYFSLGCQFSVYAEKLLFFEASSQQNICPTPVHLHLGYKTGLSKACEWETQVSGTPARQGELELLVEITGLSVSWSKAEGNLGCAEYTNHITVVINNPCALCYKGTV